jgi:hypothetical protein
MVFSVVGSIALPGNLLEALADLSLLAETVYSRELAVLYIQDSHKFPNFFYQLGMRGGGRGASREPAGLIKHLTTFVKRFDVLV